MKLTGGGVAQSVETSVGRVRVNGQRVSSHAVYSPVTKNKARWRSLLALAKGEPRDFKDGSGAILLDAAVVKALASVGDTVVLRDQVESLFRAFLAA